MAHAEVLHHGLSRALYEEVKARIADGTYGAGAPLPSTRALAAERGISRTTVSLVYEQLAADGFIETRPGAASRVATDAWPLAGRERHDRSAGMRRSTAQPGGRLSRIGLHIAALPNYDATPVGNGDIDFLYGPLASHDFPGALWLKALRTVEQRRTSRLAYDDPRGSVELRRALQSHLSHTRGLSCSVDQLVIVNGSQQALDLCARLLVDPGDVVVVENPGYRIAHHVFESYGARVQPVDVDQHGIRTDHLDAIPQAQLVFVTPTHQFPLGAFLPIGRRRALLEWAKARKAWIIEDDYDSEYRYSVRPEATLQSLDTSGCVIHVGTFSKTLSPQLRLGYMVLPAPLVSTFATARRLADRHGTTSLQRALALLLEDGSYDRHVRRMRRRQHARQAALVKALAARFGDEVVVQGAASGLHLVAWFPGLPWQFEAALVDKAASVGVRVYPVSPLFHPDSDSAAARRPAGLVMGYALLEQNAIDEGIRRLAGALAAVRA